MFSRNQALALAQIEGMVKLLEKMENRVSQQVQNTHHVPQIQPMSGFSYPTSIGSAQKQKQRTYSSSLGSWFWFLGFEGTMLQFKMRNGTTYSISIKFKTPIIGTSRTFILFAEFTIRTVPRFPAPLFCSRIFFANLVQEDAEIMTASARGDHAKVLELFDKGMAHPFDVTPSNRTPFYVRKLLQYTRNFQLTRMTVRYRKWKSQTCYTLGSKSRAGK
jgi:hypothetical protein